jgi:hypothetical protein
LRAPVPALAQRQEPARVQERVSVQAQRLVQALVQRQEPARRQERESVQAQAQQRATEQEPA